MNDIVIAAIITVGGMIGVSLVTGIIQFLNTRHIIKSENAKLKFQLSEEKKADREQLAEQKKLERIEQLSRQTHVWLGSQKVHKFWRTFLSGTCNKNLSYNTWPPEMQKQFDDRFDQMVKDPVFINTLCKRILNMSMGHLVSPHVAGAFIVASAGFLSFALIDV